MTAATELQRYVLKSAESGNYMAPCPTGDMVLYAAANAVIVSLSERVAALEFDIAHLRRRKDARDELHAENLALRERVGELDHARRIITMVAEMPASTHTVDAALCREWLADHPQALSKRVNQ